MGEEATDNQAAKFNFLGRRNLYSKMPKGMRVDSCLERMRWLQLDDCQALVLNVLP
jgi:hypothetical protein